MDIRPIDANALVASLEESYKELRKLFDEIREGEGAKEIYQGELITFLEAILRTKGMPTLDLAPVVHAYLERNDDDTSWFRELCFCSACGIGTHPYETKYCPSCGAKMDGGKKDG